MFALAALEKGLKPSKRMQSDIPSIILCLDSPKEALKFIRRCRELGFNIEQIRGMLGFIDEPNHSCGEVKAVALAQSQEVQAKIDDLRRLKMALDTMVAQCKGKNHFVEECPIIDALYL